MKLEALHRMCGSGANDGSAQQELEARLAELAGLRQQNLDYQQMLDEISGHLVAYPADESLEKVVEERNILRARLLQLQDELYRQQNRTPAKPEEVPEKEEPDPFGELKIAIEVARKQGQDVLREYEAAFPEYQTVEHVERPAESV